MGKPDTADTAIAELRNLPNKIQSIIEKLGPEGLKKSHRDGGWTAIQQIHHIADAQNITFYRIKFIISNDYPTLIPYDQNIWMQYKDCQNEDLTASMNMIKAVYSKWADFMESLTDEEWNKKALHPEVGETDIAYLFTYNYQHAKTHVRNLETILSQNS